MMTATSRLASLIARLAAASALAFALAAGSIAGVAAASPSPSPVASAGPTTVTSWCLTVHKVAVGTNKALPGAVFALTNEAAPLSGATSKTSGADGNATFCGLAAGNYSVAETKAPAGYVRDKTSHQVPINAQVCQIDSCATLTIADQAPSTDALDPASSDTLPLLPAMLAGLGLLYLAYAVASRMGFFEQHRPQA
jgi:hypothetical protein